MEEIIKTANLKKVYGLDTPYPKTALNGVSISVNKGTFACIMGTSGSGKTTLINILSTIDEATSGKLLIFDQNIVGLSDKEKANIRKRYMGFIFQDYNLLDTMTLQDNIALPLSLNGVSSQVCIAKSENLASIFGLKEHLKKYPYQLSGGQKQRGATCRALISEPEILFADEPTGALDSRSSRDLLERLKMINDEGKATILMVTHDPFSASYAKDVYILSDGMMKCRLTRGDSRKELYDRIIDTQIAMGSDFA